MPGSQSVSSGTSNENARNVTRTKGACSECRRRRRKVSREKQAHTSLTSGCFHSAGALVKCPSSVTCKSPAAGVASPPRSPAPMQQQCWSSVTRPPGQRRRWKLPRRGGRGHRTQPPLLIRAPRPAQMQTAASGLPRHRFH